MMYQLELQRKKSINARKNLSKTGLTKHLRLFHAGIVHTNHKAPVRMLTKGNPLAPKDQQLQVMIVHEHCN